MINNTNNKIVKPNVFFFKVRERIRHHNVISYYFKYDNKLYECNKDSIQFLKSTLILPYRIETYALSRANVGGIIGYLRDNNTEIMYRQIRKPNDKFLRYEILFYTKEKVIRKTR